MKNGIYLFTVALILLVSTNAFSGNVWKIGMPVNGVQAQIDGGFIIYGPFGSDSACSEGRLFFVSPNQNGMSIDSIKTSLAVVLTAFVTGKTVTFNYDSATSNCYVQTIMVNP